MMDEINERLRKIENRLSAIESKLNVHTSPSSPPPPPVLPKIVSSNTPTPIITNRPPMLEQRLNMNFSSSPLSIWIKDNWIASIGIFLVILAGGWFVNYAFTNNWIGETARVFLSFISGAAIYFTGLWLMRKQPENGQVLVILGEGVAITSLFAGHQFYSLLPAFTTFFLMLGIVTVTAIIAIKKDLEGLGFFSIAFAAIIPMLIKVDSPNSTFLMLYVLIIDAAVLWMWIKRDWGKTFHIAWLATFTYSFYLQTIHEQWIVIFFVWAFYLIFFLSITLPIIYKKKLSSIPLKGIFILLTLTLSFMLWGSFFKFPWNAISYLIASLLSAGIGCAMGRDWDQIEPKGSAMKYVLGAILGFSAMTFLFMATYQLTHNLFSDPASVDIQILLYFLEIAVAVYISYIFLQSLIVTTYLSIYFIIPIIFVADERFGLLYAPFFSLKFAIICTAIASFFIAAEVNRKSALQTKASTFQEFIGGLLWVLASVSTFILVWNICHHIFPSGGIARGVALVIYVIVAEIFIYVAHLKQLKELRVGGIGIIILVVSYLLIEEIWKMMIIVRTITFVVIGLLLIGTAFVEKKYKKN